MGCSGHRLQAAAHLLSSGRQELVPYTDCLNHKVDIVLGPIVSLERGRQVPRFEESVGCLWPDVHAPHAALCSVDLKGPEVEMSQTTLESARRRGAKTQDGNKEVN